jgi:hypothetical protein
MSGNTPRSMPMRTALPLPSAGFLASPAEADLQGQELANRCRARYSQTRIARELRHEIEVFLQAQHGGRTMKRDPLVSILMRSYNEAWALKGTLDALRQQEYTHWELIVTDSGSTDGSHELLRAARPTHFIVIERPQEYNPSRVMNNMMRLAAGEYAIFLNADATPQGSRAGCVRWWRP